MTHILPLLIDLPGAFFLLCALEKMITRSSKRYAFPLMLISCLCLYVIIIFIGDPGNILPMVFFFLLTVFLSFEGSILKKLTVGLIFASTVFSFNALRDNYLTNIALRYYNRSRYLLISYISSLAFSIFLYLMIKKLAPAKQYDLSKRMWKLLLLLTATPIGIVLTIVIWYSRNIPFNVYSDPPIEYAILLTITLFSFIGLLLTISTLARQQEQDRRIMFADMNRSYYEAMEQQHFEIRRIKHDMANHLQILSALPPEKRDDYIKKLTENAAFTQTLRYCGDTTVNAVLSVKENLMERCGIRLTCHIDIPHELPFDKTDICALFANALDNAIEACSRLETETREITLESKAQKGLFCLKVVNPAPGQDDPADRAQAKRGFFPATSKQDKENHGVGLKSMAEIASRYQGTLEFRQKDGRFEVFLYMVMLITES